jgi:hypothetical protein
MNLTFTVGWHGREKKRWQEPFIDSGDIFE